MPSHILLKDGEIHDRATDMRGPGEILATDGVISKIGPPGSVVPPGDGSENLTVLSLKGLLIFPGFIDMHVHLRTPGQEHKEDPETGLSAALAGGITSVLAMPNTIPPVDNACVVESLVHKGEKLRKARLLVSCALTRNREGRELNEYDEMREAGAVAATDDGSWVRDSSVMRMAIDYAHTCGLAALSHPEDTSLSGKGVVNEGRISARLGLAGIPREAEEIAIYRDISLSGLSGKPLHLCHLSTAEGVALVERAKNAGIPVTAETAPHYLFLTEAEVAGYDTNAKMNPPLRTPRDVLALREGIRKGTIDVIASDHAPHGVLDKEREFADASFGIIGLETIAALSFELFRELGLPLDLLSEVLHANPARVLKRPVGLAPGNPADITVIDPEKEWTYRVAEGRSKSRNSPFDGRTFTGKAVMTIVDGEVREDSR
ncbi:MAG: dihydroorotase [Deltaproteobacteria bacterium]|jgi:dihydroorotase|nr:dihydroorotase [Deltaproteobacteria bacterium]